MYKTNTEETAIELALEHSLAYGHCVFNEYWYVGTSEQLKEIGVIIHRSFEKETK